MRNKCVICDGETEFAIGLMEYVNRKKTFPFDGIACTTKSSLLDYALSNPIDILLVAESMMEEEIGSIPAVVTIILNEGLGLDACRAYEQVYKYQACETLLGDVMETFGNTEHSALEFCAVKRNGTQMIGIYSPHSDSCGTAFALAAGQILAERRKVLFLDITQFSGLEVLYGMNSARGLGDLLYYCGRKNFDLNAKLSSLVCERFGMDIVPPLCVPDDLFGVTPDQWAALIDCISEKSAYEYIIASIGIPSFALMDLCGKVFIPECTEDLSRIRTESFLTSLGRSRYREAQERIRLIRADGLKSPSVERLMEYPAYGQAGDVIKKALETEGLL